MQGSIYEVSNSGEYGKYLIKGVSGCRGVSEGRGVI